MNLVPNPRSARSTGSEPDPTLAVLPPDGMQRAVRAIRQWPGYSQTPLIEMPGLARAHGLAQVWIKDESERFGLGSFKALGGAYAVHVLLSGTVVGAQEPVDLDSLMSARWRSSLSGITVVTATDGNHGRSVAWGAQLLGCNCVVYLHEDVSVGRQEAIEALGADVIRTPGNYDDAFRQASADAERNGWLLVSDTSTPTYREIPTAIMQGYRLMVIEALEQLGGEVPTHVFVQAGCGGLAASVCAHLWQEWGDDRPLFVTVEPEQAACLYTSILAGAMTTIHGDLRTLMAGLSVGEVSPVAWEILTTGVDYAITVSDDAVVPAMRLLAHPRHGDLSVVAGESGAAGLAAVLVAVATPAARERLELNKDSRILLFNTEGATDPDLYARLVGRQGVDSRAW